MKPQCPCSETASHLEDLTEPPDEETQESVLVLDKQKQQLEVAYMGAQFGDAVWVEDT